MPKTEWMAVIRVYGSILYTTRRWGKAEGETEVELSPEHIDAWMEDCRSAGITTVLWRANCAGTLTYPSRYTALSGEPPLPPRYQLGSQVIDQGWPVEDWQFLGEQCRSFDTLAAGVKAAHRHGLRFLLDFSTFDSTGVWCTPDSWPEGGTWAFDLDLWLWSRDGKERLAGVPCYAEPRVRELMLGQIAEAIDYDIDGVFLGFFSHCDAMAGNEPGFFGYNPVVVDAFKQRHGAKPTNSTADLHRLFALHGEYFTEFVRRTGDLLHRQAKILLCTARCDGIHGWNSAAWGSGQGGILRDYDLRDGQSDIGYAGGLYLDWETWTDKGLVDGLVVYAPFPDGITPALAMRQRAKKPVYLMRKYSAWEGRLGGSQTLDGYRREIAAVQQGAIDGYAFHPMVIVRHEKMQPDWRDLLTPEKSEA